MKRIAAGAAISVMAVLGVGSAILFGDRPGGRVADAVACDSNALIEQAKSELLLTTKSGVWYASHMSTPGHWATAFDLLNQAKLCATTVTTTEATTTAPTTTTTPPTTTTTPPPLGVANVFVASNGSDTGTNCRRFSPTTTFPSDPTQVCRTLDKADSLLQNGDAGLIASGTYPAQVIALHTSRTAPATLSVVQGGTMTISNAHLTVGTAYLDLVGPFAGISEIAVAGANDNVVRAFQAHDDSISNFSAQVGFIRAHHVTWTHASIGPYHACTSPEGDEDGVQLSALYYNSAIQNSTHHITLDDVTIHDIDRWNNPSVGAASGVCSLHTDGIQGFGGDFITIRNSHIYRTATSIMIIKPESSQATQVLDHVTLTNDMFGETLEGGNGVMLGDDSQNCRGTNTLLIQNNTFGANPGLRVGCAGTKAIARNNIVPGNASCSGPTRNITYSYNAFPTGSDSGCTSTSNAQTCDPSYADANRATNGNYTRNGSDTCATNHGDPVNFTTPDIFGVTRPVGGTPDIGADEH